MGEVEAKNKIVWMMSQNKKRGWRERRTSSNYVRFLYKDIRAFSERTKRKKGTGSDIAEAKLDDTLKFWKVSSCSHARENNLHLPIKYKCFI